MDYSITEPPTPRGSILTLFDRVQMCISLLPVPLVAIWALLKSPFSAYGRAKSWKRITFDRCALHILTSLNARQVRAFFGTTSKVYSDYMKTKKLPPVVEDTGEGGRLFWIGPQKAERVILYLHGGALIFCAFASSPKFWDYAAESLRKKGKPTSVAILDYTLVPDSTFPVQLRQTILAIKHIIDSGISPENIQLVGDSAGGLLIHMVISHILHPVEGVPKLALSAPFAGAYMMSPWVTTRDSPRPISTKYDYGGDILSLNTGRYWGNKVLKGVPDSALPFLNANYAPEGWLRGVDKCVKRVLISAGGIEMLVDEIIIYAETMKSYHKDTTTIIQENGVHDDPFLDFLVGEKDLGTLTPAILTWLDEGFQ